MNRLARAALGVALVCLFAGPALAESAAARDARMAWWREARFGMFIHWGLYAVLGGEYRGQPVNGIGEWIMDRGQIPVEDYEKLASQFNPVDFDADAWAKLAAEAGMKYLVITSKHHDGFCLWDSAHTDYDIMSTPFRRDILAELKAACDKHGVKFCLYHSIMDWHHPDYLPRRRWEKRAAEGAVFNRYVEYLKSQLKELIEKYDPAVLWFDGEWESTWTHDLGMMLDDFCRGLKPDIIINNRVDKGRRGMAGGSDGDARGDFFTPEQQIPATGFPGADWETCMTMNDTWGFKKNDHRWKSTADLVRKLADIASKGGNFLLNVGPTPEGVIPAPSVERLQALGAWLKTNGEAIYGTRGTPFKSWSVRVSTKPGKLYLHLFDWPAGELLVPGLRNNVTAARLLADPAATVTATRTDEGWRLRLPERAPDPLDSVVVLEIAGEPEIARLIPPLPADGKLTARAAVIAGETLRYEDDKNCLGFWTNAADQVTWEVNVATAETRRVVLELACEDASAGSEFEVQVGGQTLRGKVPATGGWSNFTPVDLGPVQLPAGDLTLTVKATRKPGLAVMNLRAVQLLP